jgi:hypothetical protein
MRLEFEWFAEKSPPRRGVSAQNGLICALGAPKEIVHLTRYQRGSLKQG